ncbi:MAG: hypothetical protein ABJC12_03685 [Saprospiraceae bacterium]
MFPPYLRYISICMIIISIFACKNQSSNIPEIEPKTFDSYWNIDKAEITRYTLSQSDQGTVYNGIVALVFVPEQFSGTKQVKLNEPIRNPSDAIRVLRLTISKEFMTGMNKQSLMSTVFTAIDYEDYPHALKLTSGSQNWDGQSFMQFNWKGNRFQIQQMSNFETEGDKSSAIPGAWLEDEIWTKIRVAPNTLPIGDVTMIPSTIFIHLTHQVIKAYDAIASIKSDDISYTYSISYKELKRTIDIMFEKQFPYKILGWKENYGDNEVVTATIEKTMNTDFLKNNKAEDEFFLDSLILK